MKLITIGIVTLMCGCAGLGTQSAVDKNAAKTFSIMKIVDKNISEIDRNKKNQEELEKKLEEVLNFCLPKLSGFEEKSAKQAKWAYWLSMSGLLAGSVAVPALTAAAPASNSAWISGVGGWAGATNFAGQALKTSGLSGATIAQTRNKIIEKIMDQVEIASDGTKTFEERRNAIMKARSACVVYEISVPTIPDN